MHPLANVAKGRALGEPGGLDGTLRTLMEPFKDPATRLGSAHTKQDFIRLWLKTVGSFEVEGYAMAAGILRMYLMLMAVVGVNEPFFSDENGVVDENGDEILQRMKERETSLRLHQLRLEQEIADLEAGQKALEMRELELERKIQQHMFSVLSLVILTLISVWRQN
ncbi:inositol 1,4,5-trisphosphate receptor-interacting protein-like [Corapipo altera]|uniref:inositol 1,4,5-trisphosphate receptor-interacting protein-like n=1 Tax=Corapipo altera TaxID=415028 RepID=UPI000FD64FC1|nr:inositol 1,4,5-trisphosphate receptor-interacting protein-like [Corapipo altera]